MIAQDIADPDRLNKIKWGHAISQWEEGDASLLRPLLNDASMPIPDFAREFLAELAEGEAHKENGRPQKRFGEVERAITCEVFIEWERQEGIPKPPRIGKPRDIAIEQVAARRKMRNGQVTGVVNKLFQMGITKECWQSWGRPDWMIKKPT